MKELLKRGATAAAPIARDLVGLAGLGLVVAGVLEFSRGLAMIVAGGLLVGAVVLLVRRG